MRSSSVAKAFIPRPPHHSPTSASARAFRPMLRALQRQCIIAPVGDPDFTGPHISLMVCTSSGQSTVIGNDERQFHAALPRAGANAHPARRKGRRSGRQSGATSGPQSPRADTAPSCPRDYSLHPKPDGTVPQRHAMPLIVVAQGLHRAMQPDRFVIALQAAAA